MLIAPGCEPAGLSGIPIYIIFGVQSGGTAVSIHSKNKSNMAEKSIILKFDEATGCWNMTTNNIASPETIGVLALFMDKVRYERLFMIEKYIQETERNLPEPKTKPNGRRSGPKTQK